ncbi:hypothetical protein [Bradyrhizobium sp. dw_78]|uniref:hypothetical protein n=1 Tax=Bradyrhizobium sp. dw_78 TaxID=2719793 RepID=UPI001BD5A9E9|nr:hypothetical protein [Bradyrhizobium sp. dw_78]
MAKSFEISPRKSLAMGSDPLAGAGDFGVDATPLKGGKAAPDRGEKVLRDHERGTGKPVRYSKGKLPAQAEADHGDHL